MKIQCIGDGREQRRKKHTHTQEEKSLSDFIADIHTNKQPTQYQMLQILYIVLCIVLEISYRKVLQAISFASTLPYGLCVCVCALVRSSLAKNIQCFSASILQCSVRFVLFSSSIQMWAYIASIVTETPHKKQQQQRQQRNEEKKNLSVNNWPGWNALVTCLATKYSQQQQNEISLTSYTDVVETSS